MAVDTFAKRMTVGGVPFHALGPNVFPGTTSATLGRAAAAWNYVPVAAVVSTVQDSRGELGVPFHTPGVGRTWG